MSGFGASSTTSGGTLEHADLLHLTRIEWDALHRLAAVSGELLVTALLSAATPEQHRLAVHEFMEHELTEARKSASPPASKLSQSQAVKLETSTFSGEGADRMPLNR
jgi:hypothetical protein|uniref:Uncharacterized protein n=1 Tax=Globisporangium ultimum (strain ATCC 200006 / CBS 805.95 / DAOM BR144) TaxID=431595 RepID=K3WDP1_GLOUD